MRHKYILYFSIDSNVPVPSTAAEKSQAIAEVAPIHLAATSQQERATPRAECSASLQQTEKPHTAPLDIL